MDIASISPRYYCKFCNTSQVGSVGIMGHYEQSEGRDRDGDGDTPDAEQAKGCGRKEECNQAPCIVEPGDRAPIGVQHRSIQPHLITSSIKTSLRLKSQMSG